MELSPSPTSFSELIGTQVEDQSGRALGRVFEVRARWEKEEILFEELMVGRDGLLHRLAGPGPRARGIRWDAVVDCGPDRIVVRSSKADPVS